MRKLTVKTLCLVAVLLVFAAQAGAVNLTIANLSGAQLDVLRGVGAIPIIFLNSNYELSPANGAPPDDGLLTSQVFTGINEAAGLFIYMYSMTNLATAGSVNAMDLEFGNVVPTTIVPGATLAAAGYGGGNFEVFSFDFTGTGVAPSEASWLGPPGDLNFSFVGNGSIPPLGGSTFYGVFSPLPPTQVIANLLGGAANPVLIQPSALGVSTRVPEPGTLMLLGFGLAGLALCGRRRARSR